MNTLADIETAADALSDSEKQELLLFLAARMRRERASASAPRQFTEGTLRSGIAEDEAALERLSAIP